MIIKHSNEVPLEPVQMDGIKDIKMRLLLSDKDGVPNFVMRLFEVAPGGNSPYHTHNYEHEVFILEGEGIVRAQEKDTQVKHGDVVLVMPNEEHQFQNSGDKTLKFLCFIPLLTE